MSVRIHLKTSLPEEFRIPDDVSSLEVPESTTPSDLREIVMSLLDSGSDVKAFEFLVEGELLKAMLGEHIRHLGIIAEESLVEVEYILTVATGETETLDCDDWVSAVRIIPGGFASGSYDGILRVWKGGSIEKELAISPQALTALDTANTNEGELLLSVGSLDGGVSLLSESDGLTERQKYTGHGAGVCDIKFFPNSELICSCGWDCRIKIWEKSPVVLEKAQTEGGEMEPMASIEGGKNVITAVCVPNDETLVSASHDGSVRFWDVVSTQESLSLGSDAPLTALDVSKMNELVCAGTISGNIHVLSRSSSEKIITQFSAHKSMISAVKWSPLVENVLFTVSYDEASFIWDLRSTKEPVSSFHSHSGRILTCDWEGKTILSGGCDSKIVSLLLL